MKMVANGTLLLDARFFIERNDFMEDPPKKYFRLGIDRLVRLKHAFIIRADEFDTDGEGNVTEVRCTYFPDSKSGADVSGLKPKGTLHWVNANDHIEIEVREYDRLFSHESPESGSGDFMEFLNQDSLNVIPRALAEPELKNASKENHFQFLRKGYYHLDLDSADDKVIFNRTVSLRDSWSKRKVGYRPAHD